MKNAFSSKKKSVLFQFVSIFCSQAKGGFYSAQGLMRRVKSSRWKLGIYKTDAQEKVSMKREKGLKPDLVGTPKIGRGLCRSHKTAVELKRANVLDSAPTKLLAEHPVVRASSE